MEYCSRVIGNVTERKRILRMMCALTAMLLVISTAKELPDMDYENISGSGGSSDILLTGGRGGGEYLPSGMDVSVLLSTTQSEVDFLKRLMEEDMSMPAIEEMNMDFKMKTVSACAEMVLENSGKEAESDYRIEPGAGIVPEHTEGMTVPDAIISDDTEKMIVPDVIIPDYTEEHTVPDVISPDNTEDNTTPDVIVPDHTGENTIPDVIVPDHTEGDTTPDVPVPDTGEEELVPDIPSDETAADDTVVPDVPDTEDSDETEIPEDITSGFLINDEGMIYGFAAEEAAAGVEGVLTLPSEGCSGILRGALDGAGAGIYDVVIPDNITYIEDGALSGLEELFCIWVGENNPAYAAVDEVLYDKGVSTLLAFPAGRTGTYAVPGSTVCFGEGAFAYSNLEKLDMRSCGLVEVRENAFGEHGGVGMTIMAPREYLEEYQNLFAPFQVTVE